MNEQIGGTYTDGAEELREKYLTFWTEGQLFGVPIAEVVQIVGMQRITALPDCPRYAKGIIDLRGSIIPLVDVRLRLGKPEREYDERTCIIVINVGERLFGLIVDEVDEVSTIPADRVSQPPRMGGDGTTPYLTGIARLGEDGQERIVLCVDATKILGEGELDALFQAAQ